MIFLFTSVLKKVQIFFFFVGLSAVHTFIFLGIAFSSSFSSILSIVY